MSYHILHIPSGRLVCFFNPQALPEAKTKLWGAHHRRPPQFWINDRNTNGFLSVPDWVVNSIMGPKGKMYKRLCEGVGKQLMEEENINNITVCFEEFEFIKLEE